MLERTPANTPPAAAAASPHGTVEHVGLPIARAHRRLQTTQPCLAERASQLGSSRLSSPLQLPWLTRSLCSEPLRALSLFRRACRRLGEAAAAHSYYPRRLPPLPAARPPLPSAAMDAACVAQLQAALDKRHAAPFVAVCREALRQKAAFPALRQCVKELLAEVRTHDTGHSCVLCRCTTSGGSWWCCVAVCAHDSKIEPRRRQLVHGCCCHAAAACRLACCVPSACFGPFLLADLQAHDDEETGLGDFLLSAVEVGRRSLTIPKVHRGG